MARRGFDFGGMSVEDLQRQIKRMQRGVKPLMRKRQTLLSKLAVVDAKIAALGGSAGGAHGVRKRPKNETNLVEALEKVLTGKTMGVQEVAEAVQKAGYQTTSPSFRVIVNQALLANKNKFKRVERGQYTAK